MKKYSILAIALLFMACGGADLYDEPQANTTSASSTEEGDEQALERFQYIAVIADTHIVLEDDLQARNLRAIGEVLAQLPVQLLGVFIAGDIVYNLPYHTIEEYHNDPNDRFDIAQAILEEFPAPCYLCIGNHDLAIEKGVPRQMTEQLFMEHFGAAPYYLVDLGLWKFIVLNNFHGPTQDPHHPSFDVQTGSLGQEQREWLKRQLNDGRPAILMSHFPPFIINDLSDIFEEYRHNIRLFLAGHSHGWANLSNHFGVPSLIVGTSQLDEDTFMIMELDNKLKTWRIIDWERFHWGSAYSTPWDNSFIEPKE